MRMVSVDNSLIYAKRPRVMFYTDRAVSARVYLPGRASLARLERVLGSDVRKFRAVWPSKKRPVYVEQA